MLTVLSCDFRLVVIAAYIVFFELFFFGCIRSVYPDAPLLSQLIYLAGLSRISSLAGSVL